MQTPSAGPGAAVQRQPSVKPAIPDHELLKLIGSGAYGEVWLARSVTGAYRAVKVVYRRRFEDSRPFEREFKGIQKFEPISRSHASQVDVLHVGRTDDYFYYVMELADDLNVECGFRNAESATAISDPTSHSALRAPHLVTPGTYSPKTLKSELARRGCLPFDECLRVALSLTTALEHLHQHGLIHRDIKPSNIIFVAGVPKLADIGLVASTDATRSFVGTEGFVPPEGPGAPQGDIFSLGKVLYEMCTGRDRQQFPELPTQLREAPDRENLVELNEIVLKACEHDTRKRYQSAEEMHADLALLQAGKSVRRARGIEKQLRRLTRFGLIAAAVVVVSTAAWLHQKQQTRQIRFWAEQSRQRLVRLHTSEGLRRIEDGDLLRSLPWLVESLKLDQGSTSEEGHRVRLGSVLRQAPELTAFWHVPGPFDFIEVSPDSRSVLTVQQNSARVWDLESGKPRTPSLQHEGAVLSASFSPEGDRVATSTQSGEVIVWNLSSAKKIAEINEPGSRFTRALFSPDGQRVALAAHEQQSDRCYLGIWDVTSETSGIRKLAAQGEIRHLCFSADGRNLARVVARFGTEVSVFDAHTGDVVLGPLQVPHLPFVQFSPGGQSLCVALGDTGVKIWDLSSGQSREVLQPSETIQSIAFNHDGKWVAVGTGLHFGTGSGSAYICDAQTGKLVAPRISHPRPILSVAFSPDDRHLLTTSDDAVVRVWEVRSGQMAVAPLPHESPLQRAVFAGDGRCVVTVAEQTVRLWDLSTLGSIVQFLRHPRVILACASSPTGPYFATGTDWGTAQVWDTTTWRRVGPALPCGHLIRAIAFHPNGRLLATGGDSKAVHIWKVGTRELVAPPLAHQASVTQLQFHPDGDKLFTVSSNAVHLWDTTSWRPLRPPILLPRAIATSSWGPGKDGLTAACTRVGQSSEVFSLNWQTGQISAAPQSWPGDVIYILPKTNEVWLGLAQDDFSLRFWNSRTCLPMTPPLRNESRIRRVALSRSQTKAALASQSGITRLWDVSSGEEIGPLSRHGMNVVQVAEFGPDERSMLTASDGGTLRVWDCSPTGRSLQELEAEAAMLSAHEVDRSGAMVPASPARLGEVWRRLKPQGVSSSDEAARALAWHRRLADECEESQTWHEREEDWPVAYFHRTRAIELVPDSAPDLLRRGIASVRVNNNWEQAKADYDKAVSLGVRQEYLEADFVILQIIAGDVKGYQRSCAELVKEFGATQSPDRANDVVWLLCLAPQALPSYDLPVRMMRQVAETPSLRNNVFNTYGAILFRAGRYQEAIEILHQATKYHPDGGTPFDFVFLAMAHQALSQTNEAQAYLGRAQRSAVAGGFETRWKWRTEFALLQKEAEQSILAAPRRRNGEKLGGGL